MVSWFPLNISRCFLSTIPQKVGRSFLNLVRAAALVVIACPPVRPRSRKTERFHLRLHRRKLRSLAVRLRLGLGLRRTLPLFVHL